MSHQILHHRKDAFKFALAEVLDDSLRRALDWGGGVGGGGLSLPVFNSNPIPMPAVPQPLCKILVILAKLHFTDYSYFPRGLLFRIRPMILPPGAQNILLGRSCSSIQRNKTEVSPGLQIFKIWVGRPSEYAPLSPFLPLSLLVILCGLIVCL